MSSLPHINKNEAVETIIHTSEDIRIKTAELALRIDNDYKDKGTLVLVGILKGNLYIYTYTYTCIDGYSYIFILGAFIFLSDLSRHITIPHRVEFMAVSSYSGTTSTGSVKVRILSLSLFFSFFFSFTPNQQIYVKRL